MTRIVIVGGGYTGFYTAWGLEKKLRPGQAEVVVIDPRPYMTYQPFLPEVAAGSIEARHAAVSQRRHLTRTRIVTASVTRIDHASKAVTVAPRDGQPYELGYDQIVVTAGAVTRTFPIPGLEQVAIGLKHVEEAAAIRDKILTAFDRAATLAPGPERAKLLTVAVIGGGFSGVELFGELLSLARALLKRYPEISASEVSFHLVDAMDRILPEVSRASGEWVVRHLEKRGARVHLSTQLVSAEGGHLVLSTGEAIDAHTIVWTAGNGATRVVAKNTDLPTNARGSIVVRADLRVGTRDQVVEDAWAAGDDAAVPDLASPVPGALTVPNAQHAVRQGRLLARNIAAALNGRPVKEYRHASLGVVATLGIGLGLFEYKKLVITGVLSWIMHRGYHVLVVPSWERKVRVLAVWITAFLFGRDIVSLEDVAHPRRAFVEDGFEPVGGARR
ncbi:FAD-dependent oxidoreductase [Gryllotalpicola daejeonensis]|uniref:FAD-dependent oxidoreductase n=1 Tax=Gryllotalpicola daejeonensis TaxID=993087 RepID=A0ABP7ZNS7_9MICO